MTQAEFRQQYDSFIAELDKESGQISDTYADVDEQVYVLVISFLLSLRSEGLKYVINSSYSARLYELRVDLLNLFSTNENIVSLLNKASEYNISAHVILNKISTSDVDVLRTIHNMERDIRVGGIVGAFEKTVVDPILGLVNGIVASNTSIKTVKSILAPLKKGESAIQGLYKVSSAVGLVKNFVDEAATVIPNIQSNYLVSRYKFKYFLWVGSLVAHSRPLCVHLISKGGIEQYKNVRSLVATYPQGLYKGTDETNITYLAGGHYCRHRVFPIRDPRIFI